MNKFLIKEIFKIYGGASGLTEKVIYENQSEHPEGNIYVFSGATEEKYHLPKVDINLRICNKPIKVFSDKHSYLLVARKGKAGSLKLIKGVSFTINDDAYVMQLKKNFATKVNLIYFINKYQETFFDFVSSKDGNGTFSKEIAENYEVQLPCIDTQNKVLKEKEALRSLRESLEAVMSFLDKNKKIITEGESYLLRDLFLLFQGHQLTDKKIYDNAGKYPVLSGADSEPKGFINKPLFSDESKLPCLIYQTKGNNEFKSKVVRNLFNANNTAVLYVKKSKEDMVNIDYVQLVIAHNMQLAISSQEGVSYIDTKILDTEICLPSIEAQNEIVEKNKKLAEAKEKLQKKIDSINTQLSKQVEL